MTYIRSMINKGKPMITFKELMHEINDLKKLYFSNHGSSFDYKDKTLQKALKNLNKMKIIQIYHKADFDNAEILSNLSPDQIKAAIKLRDDLPS